MAVHFFKVHTNSKKTHTKNHTASGILPVLSVDNYYFGLVAFFTVHSKKDSGANSKASHGNEYSKRC